MSPYRTAPPKTAGLAVKRKGSWPLVAPAVWRALKVVGYLLGCFLLGALEGGKPRR